MHMHISYINMCILKKNRERRKELEREREVERRYKHAQIRFISKDHTLKESAIKIKCTVQNQVLYQSRVYILASVVVFNSFMNERVRFATLIHFLSSRNLPLHSYKSSF